MKKSSLLLLVLAIVTLMACNRRSGTPKVLVFSKTAGFRHSSIGDAKTAIQKLGAENGFTVDTTEDASYINEDSLKNYSAVIFLHSTGNMLDSYQEADFERYIQSGGGYVGIHAASDAEYDWGWYGKLVGGYFESHPEQQMAKIDVKDATHISTKHLPKEWNRKDEWYNFKKLNPDVKVLLTIDEKSYKGGKNGDNHPMAWYHEFDGGRAWYTELGHTEASFTEENYLKHILGGIQYAIGDNKELDYSKATSARVPDEDRFSKTILSQGTLFEPTEMTILPNLDILVAQRRGEVLLFKNSDKSVKQVGFLNVYWKTVKTPGVNAEEGLLGLQADPNFAQNHFVYLFYSPADTSVNRLSRFKFENDSLILSSEKIVLQFYSQREICCHTGGSIAFGPDSTLFVSTGDNSTPFDQPGTFANHGFAPLDDRPGFEQYDARRSSGNTNDLRGKILRIKIHSDGSYSIPEGNLFPVGTEKTKPEIYVMGNRNPYRISADKKNGYLYWGEVGPDAGNDSLETRGPRGYDELNQAKKAGFFGWPLFVGNNYPYYEYDYTNGDKRTPFDPAKPKNNSRNNTGLVDLPAVSPAFIWYPYGASADFPQLGTGGRTAMAGPIFYADMFPKETRMPDYYNGKVFIYEWMRNFIKVVTLDKQGDFSKMESFMSSTKLNAVIDMEMGPDGRIYLLEYGSGWFSKNPDAGISRIDYNGGNRMPVVADLKVNKLSGSLPFQLEASITARDPEKEQLTYLWDLGNGITKETKEPRLSITLDKAGEYPLFVTVSDPQKASVRSDVMEVYAGNEIPEVDIVFMGNQSFYFPGDPVEYAIRIKDKEDPEASKNSAGLMVSADYAEGTDKAALAQGHQIISAATMGKNTMLSLDCKNCHQVDQKSIGPSFTEVSKKYQKDPKAPGYLADKIIRGGAGVWGEVPMAAHPNLKPESASQIVTWVLSLAAEKKNSLPATGKISPLLNKPVKDNGLFYLTATYTDKGGPGIKSMTGTTTRVLKNNKMNFFGASDMKSFSSIDMNGSRYMVAPVSSGSFKLGEVDLSGIRSLFLAVGWQKAPDYGYDIEYRLDSPEGTLLGKASLAGGLTTTGPMGGTGLMTVISPVTDGKIHSVYVVCKSKDPKEANQFALINIQFNQ